MIWSLSCSKWAKSSLFKRVASSSTDPRVSWLSSWFFNYYFIFITFFFGRHPWRRSSLLTGLVFSAKKKETMALRWERFITEGYVRFCIQDWKIMRDMISQYWLRRDGLSRGAAKNGLNISSLSQWALSTPGVSVFLFFLSPFIPSTSSSSTVG